MIFPVLLPPRLFKRSGDDRPLRWFEWLMLAPAFLILFVALLIDLYLFFEMAEELAGR